MPIADGQTEREGRMWTESMTVKAMASMESMTVKAMASTEGMAAVEVEGMAAVEVEGMAAVEVGVEGMAEGKI
jgi:hypothetical protein